MRVVSESLCRGFVGVRVNGGKNFVKNCRCQVSDLGGVQTAAMLKPCSSPVSANGSGGSEGHG